MINRVIRNFQIKKYLGSSFSKVGEVAGSLIKKVVQKYKEIDRIIKEIDRIEEVKAEINTSLTANGNANAKDVCGKTLVHRAAWIGDTEKLRVCKRAGIDIDIEAKDVFDNTPLHCAADRGRTETFKYLVEEAGADVEAETTGGDKVIHIAIFPENIEMVECLAKAKADLNAKDGFGQTPLHKAISFQCTKMVECLIKVRANINATDSKGRTPRDLVNDLESQDRDMEKIKDLLIEAGAKTSKALREEKRQKVPFKVGDVRANRDHALSDLEYVFTRALVRGYSVHANRDHALEDLEDLEYVFTRALVKGYSRGEIDIAVEKENEIPFNVPTPCAKGIKENSR